MNELSEPFEEIKLGEERVPISRDNLLLFRHIGIYAIYDHCYIVKPNGGGAYIWAHNPGFERFAALAHEHQAPIALNRTKPSESDMDWYFKHASDDLDQIDEVSMEWQEQAGES